LIDLMDEIVDGLFETLALYVWVAIFVFLSSSVVDKWVSGR